MDVTIKKPRLESRFIIRGDLDPDDVTRRIGLESSSIWHRGEPRARSRLRWNDSGWIVSEGPARTMQLSQQIEALLSRIEPHRAQLQSTVSDLSLDTVLYCVVAVDDQTPVVELSPDLLRRVADLGTPLMIDITLIEL